MAQGDLGTAFRFGSIQCLRAAAALQVVAFHAVAVPGQRPGTGAGWPNGAAGVDLFFVISGFVMAVSSDRLEAGAWWGFLRRRLVRVVPLYWVMTLLKALSVLALPGAALRTVLTPAALAASLLFLPVRDGAGHFAPVLPVGWTLSFEMLFYCLFALAVGQGVRPLRLVTPVLAVLAVLPREGSAFGLLCDPIVLEFVLGTLAGVLWLRGWRMGLVAGLLACVGGAGCLLLLPSGGTMLRPLDWGVPAAFLVAGAVSVEAAMRPRLPAILLRLGDASYAIYLSHGFVLAALPVLLGSLGVEARPVLVLALGVPACAGIGLALHVLAERPLLAAFSREGAGGRLAEPRCAA